MAKRKSNPSPKLTTFDEDQFQAEQQVRDAFMNMPETKKIIRQVKKKIKADKAKVKTTIRKKIKK